MLIRLQRQVLLTTKTLFSTVLICFLTLASITHAISPDDGRTSVRAEVEFYVRSGGRLASVPQPIVVPPSDLAGLEFDGEVIFNSASVSPAGIRCFLRRRINAPDEINAGAISARVSNVDATSEMPNRRHLSPLFGKITEEDELSNYISFRDDDQGWMKFSCFQTDGTEFKVLLEYEDGTYDFITLRRTRFGTAQYLRRDKTDRGDILRATILQAPREDLVCKLFSEDIWMGALAILKPEEINYSPISGFFLMQCGPG